VQNSSSTMWNCAVLCRAGPIISRHFSELLSEGTAAPELSFDGNAFSCAASPATMTETTCARLHI
jgi:hypothetical protein